MKKKLSIITAAVLLILGAAVLKSKYNTDDVQSQTRFLMDTYCTIQVPGSIEVLDVINLAFKRIEEIDSKFDSL
ncbi:MAG: hypothetical protein JXB48_10435, partial [Candidatus Latescibacteria bacterium]|nr:hypothetical protein [Candidatus Latescibacterota bacterium]